MTSKNFLRELYSPIDKDAEIDIVAVHGLNPKGSHKHAEETWTANKKMWLKDFLPLKLETARILLFGYNSNVAFETSTSGVRDHAMNLLNLLKLERKHSMERPLIFICHSLGGLVVKRALVIAQAAETYISIRNATYGIVFFGTPHRGGNGASLGNIAASIARFCLRNPSNSFMESLKKDSLFASELVDDFQLQLESYYVLSFYETLPYKRLGVIVDQESATLGLSINRETQIGLNAHHSNICKFEASDDDAYKQVEGNIIDLVERALLAAEERTRLAEIHAPVTQRLSLIPAIYSDKPRSDIFSVPFRRNEDFTGRDPILAKLGEKLAFQRGYQPRVVLYGLGGTGKTQIAVEFAYRTKMKAIYWISGESDEGFTCGYAGVAETVSLALADTTEESVCASVKAWFETKESGDWLLIIDNFDDISLKFKRWLPSRNGAIIFTSRDKRAAGAVGTSTSAAIEVSNMTNLEAIKTFARLTASETTQLARSKIDRLLRLLDNLPLAIAHAAAYIQQTNIPVEDYISIFGRDRETLLADEFQPSPDMPPRSVIGTLTITVEKIRREQPLTMKLLELMSLLDCQSIPKTLLRSLSWPELEKDIDFFKTIGVLLNYSLVSQISQHEYRLHDLVGLSTRVHMQPATYSTRLTDAVELLHDTFPYGTFENVAQCSLLLPHAISVISKAEMIGLTLRSIYDVEYKMARHLEERGVYSRANDSAETSFQPTEALGLIGQNISRDQDLLGRIQTNECKRAGALEWYRRALVGREKALGIDHPDTLDAVYGVALVFYNQRKCEDALEWYRRALAGREKALGKDHPSTLNTVGNMALVFYNQGKYEDALKWYRRALAGYEKALGKDHPSTLGAVNNMALVFYNQGKYEDALEWYRRALAGYEKALGKDHPSTLNTVGNMASVFKNQGKYEDALEWYRRELAGKEKALGKDHPSTLDTIHNMALVFYNQGKYEDALEWYRRALAGYEKALSMDHPSTLDTVNNMAIVFKNQGKYEDALEWYRRALAGKEKALGKDHPSTLNTVHNMASVFTHQGKHEDALEWYRRALAGCEKALGKDHPSTLNTVGNMASVFDNQGKYEDALEWYRRALAGYEKDLGKEHPSTLDTVYNMAIVFKNQEKYEDALEWYRRALAGYEKALGNYHPSTLDTVNSMALLFASREKPKDSFKRYIQALSRGEKTSEWRRRVLSRCEKALSRDRPVRNT